MHTLPRAGGWAAELVVVIICVSRPVTLVIDVTVVTAQRGVSLAASSGRGARTAFCLQGAGSEPGPGSCVCSLPPGLIMWSGARAPVHGRPSWPQRHRPPPPGHGPDASNPGASALPRRLEYLHQKRSRVTSEAERQVLEKQSREAEKEVRDIR